MEKMAAQAESTFLADRYLTFKLGCDTYGLPIRKVQALDWLKRTKEIPLELPFTMGDVVVRGNPISVTNMRLKLGMDPVENTRKSCIIAVLPSSHSDIKTGILVDEVCEVLSLPGSQISKVTESQAPRFVTGMAQVNDKAVMVLDIDQALSF